MLYSVQDTNNQNIEVHISLFHKRKDQLFERSDILHGTNDKSIHKKEIEKNNC